MKKLLAIILLCGIVFSTQAQTWINKINPVLIDQTANGQKVDFFIIFREQADLKLAKQIHGKQAKGQYVFEQLQKTAQNTQGNIVQILEDAHTKFQRFFVLNAIFTNGNVDLLQKIGMQPEVAYLVPNLHSRLEKLAPNTNIYRNPELTWGLTMIQADSVWAMGYQGQGVTIGGQDTGYDWTHPALQKQYRGWDTENNVADHNYNWHDAIHAASDTLGNICGYNSPEPCDDNSHGTHTMGTMLGSDGDLQIGVAPQARWIAARNMDKGNGTLQSYTECFEWFMAPTDLINQNPDPSKAPHVISNSWYCSTGEGCNETNFDIMRQVVDNVKAAGIVVVVAAGNSGSAGCSSVSGPPGFFDSSFTVGSIDPNDTISSFSSRGPVSIDGSNRLKPQVVAPGRDVNSCIPGGSYGAKSGTSMATPHVAGLVALLISVNPDLAGEVDSIEHIIEQTAVPKTTDENCGDISGAEVPNNTYGFGRVNAFAAAKAVLAAKAVAATNHLNTDDIKIFPNPAFDKINIQFPKPYFGNLYLLNSAGQVIEIIKVANSTIETIPIENIPGGLYFLKTDNGIAKKFLKI